MPRPHVHPSVNCYKKHHCRCDECRALATEVQRVWRERRIERGARWVWDGRVTRLKFGRPYEGVKSKRTVDRQPLPPDEVVRLRRLVGLPPEGPRKYDPRERSRRDE